MNFIYMDGNTVKFIAPSKLLRIPTSTTAELLYAHVYEVKWKQVFVNISLNIWTYRV